MKSNLLPPPAQPLVIRAPLNKKTGYGHQSYYLITGLIKQGVPVRLEPLDDGMTDVPKDLRHLVQPAGRSRGWEILIFPPWALADKHVTTRTVVFTSWECSRLEAAWVRELNKSRGVALLCEWNAVCFSAAGVHVPLKVIPAGHNPAVFNPAEEPPAVCTFGVAGALWDAGVRKNVIQTIDAFRQAFPGESDVRLKVKITQKCPLPPVADPRIEICRDHLSEPELARWYRSLSAIVSVSAGEAFSLHLLEAMACGRPVITCQFGGPAEYFDEQVGYPVAYELAPATGYPIYSGLWSRFNPGSLVRTLRHVYDHQSEAARKGRAAAHRAGAFTWDRMGDRALAFLDELGMLSATPPRIGRGFWGTLKQMLKSA
jgi:glycosyltransferase involved in cell wall biosynthesis